MNRPQYTQTQFKPAWWLRNSHLQTIFPVMCRPRQVLPLETERMELPDGDFVDLNWLGKNQTGPLVFILHGFEGSIESHYAKSMMRALHKEGWRCVFMHFRGCSGEPNRLPRSYHSGDTKDAEFVVNTLQAREPATAISAIGYSLGGNVLLKWLGETDARNPLKAAVAISVPFELDKAAERIQHGFSRFYQWYFLRCLRERLLQKFAVVPTSIDPATILVNDIRLFDDRYTAPLHGFSGVEEYYAISSCRQYLNRISVPTLIVHAKDDPFMSADVIPALHELSPSVTLEVSEAGGHVGFVSGKLPWRPIYWLEERIPQFLREMFKV